MRKNTKMIAVLVVVCSCFLLSSVAEEYMFSQSDEVGDEEGIYPLSEEFAGLDGLFDLLQFDMRGNDTYLSFSFEFAQLPNPRNGTLGFTYPVIELYVHTSAPGSFRLATRGSTRSPLSNSNIRIDDRYSWERMLHINGWEALVLNDAGDSTNTQCVVTTQGNTISAVLRDHSLGTPNDLWSFSVFVGSFNFSSSGIADSFRQVQKDPTDDFLGGGDESDVDPNVIDLLTLPNAAWTQKHILYSYCTKTHSNAITQPVGANPPPYMPILHFPSSVVSKEEGGIGCIDSDYQLSPQERFVVLEKEANQWQLEYSIDANNLQEYGEDERNLLVRVEEVSNCILRVIIQDMDKQRFQLPFVRDNQKPYNCSTKQYEWSVHDRPFGIQVQRMANSEDIFNSRPSNNHPFRNLVFKDQYIEFSTRLPEETDIFGLGERISSLKLDKNNKVYSIFNIDQGTPSNQNLYGSHPFYLEMRENHSHGVFMANNMGMDVVLANNRLTYKMTGGIIDMYIFMGPTVQEVTKQYQSIIGYPVLPPFWSLGYHQSRWGYQNIQELEDVVATFAENELPLDTVWSDIDYMDDYKLWTLDPVNYPSSQTKQFVNNLHASDQHYVMIVDPGVKQEEGYEVWEEGKHSEIFIQNTSGSPYTGKVWPGLVSFVDFYHPNATAYWSHYISAFHQQVPFDGLWIDMNEIANFCDGHCVLGNQETRGDQLFECLCLEPEYHQLDFPPYFVGGRPPSSGTISMASIHYDNVTEYNLHNLYGYMESKATYVALANITEKRSFVLSRSTFSGSGHYSAHWLGDNTASWEDMRNSIAGIINMNLFGIPFVGADVCGFNGNTTAELCARWMQLGAFYPFYRNHNGIGFDSQEPYAFGKTITKISRNVLQLRYSLLSFFYSYLVEISENGGTFVDSLAFLYPSDTNCRSLSSQFVVAKSLMVAPVLSQGALEHHVYFPLDNWYDFFTGEIVLRNSYINNQTEAIGKWILFDEVHLEDMFVFIRGGSIVFSQSPALTSRDTKNNPYDIIIALHPNYNEVSFGKIYIDDGESLDAPNSLWEFSAWLGEDRVGRINATLLKNDSGIPVNLRNITLFGVPPPCTIVLLNNSELEFEYNLYARTLIISVEIQLTNSFTIVWGKANPKQSLAERSVILIGSLLFTVSILSIVALLLLAFRRKFPSCQPPSWLRIPDIKETPEYQRTNTEEEIETEMQVFETSILEDENSDELN